ncbi:RNA polymerase-binding ATPase [Chromatium okenii]|uniref:RNA polymerase-associated protein RapA n=1 Tax=Chromatium okenii TaxID=61644 RepID=UPI00190586CE|nr:RNA polymerase-associated protein RapA [Chromatium okenii]MBK1641129.1 RNA polymerase-binding ATPase [Chromatium okenii]
MNAFIPGQRWLSTTQSELGLGVVEAVEGRHVRIAFPASGETRLYAMAQAPLARVELHVGERIRDRSGQSLRVIGSRASAGLITYECETLDGQTCAVPETALDDRLQLNRPQQRLLAGRVDAAHWLRLRHQTWLQGMREAQSPTLGLLGARVALIPHQLSVAAEVAGREAPRVLLADEVGLGKTIEAGLILQRLLLTGQAQRVLIVTPEPLLHQWLVELRRRFNLRFALFDDERVDLTFGGNPFQDEQQVLCSLDVLLASPAIQRAALAGQWDVLVVDEAHHLGWSPTAVSAEYALIAALAERTPSVLLLTATPEQLGRAGHFGRLRLLDPARFHDLAAFEAETAGYAPVAQLATRLLDDQPLTAADQTLLQTLLDDSAQLPRASVIARLLDRHGTGRVLFRNTRAAIHGFPERQLLAYPLPALTASDAAAPASFDTDPRLNWLITTLRELRPAKVLLICAHAQTVLELREALRQRAGIHAAVFHEHMDIVERDRAAAYFAAVEDGTQILLCSEIGSEGRNFQFVHHLVLFDLPLEPDVLEQRIGRLDRIGQTETIRLHVPYRVGTADAVLFRWYAEGLSAFNAICPAAAGVYAQLKPQLLAALADPSLTDGLIAEAQRLTAQLNAELAAGRDRLLELHSHHPQRAAALIAALEERDASGEVAAYMQQFWDAFGVDFEDGSGSAVVVRPGTEMLHDSFPQLPEDGLTATFIRAAALAHEDHAFLTWEHPMVREAMELLTASDLGAAAITLVRNGRFGQPTLLLELLYIVECLAPPALHVGRFLPPTVVRLVLNAAGEEVTAEFAPDALDGECLSHNAELVETVITSQRSRLLPLFEQGERLAHAALGALTATAQTELHTQLGAEVERLTTLALVNPTVRADEIGRLQHRRAQLTLALTRAEVRLDAVRLVVMM